MKYFADYRMVPAAAWPWEHFAPAEIACRGDDSILINPAALDALAEARARQGRAFVVLSAYRSALHNARVGGAPRSAHKDGIAFDIALEGHEPEALLAACRAAGFGSFGRYPTFLHVDLRQGRSWGTWNS